MAGGDCIANCGVSGRNNAAAIPRFNSRSCKWVLISRGGRGPFPAGRKPVCGFQKTLCRVRKSRNDVKLDVPIGLKRQQVGHAQDSTID